MREIKFRVWTGLGMEYNVMAGWLGAFYVQGIDPKDSACMSPYNTIYSKSVPVMQFTGLLDKNGKEIYEGDILYLDKWHENVQVAFIKGVFCLNLLDGNPPADIHYIRYDGIPQATVVGNSYENPELLK